MNQSPFEIARKMMVDCQIRPSKVTDKNASIDRLRNDAEEEMKWLAMLGIKCIYFNFLLRVHGLLLRD